MSTLSDSSVNIAVRRQLTRDRTSWLSDSRKDDFMGFSIPIVDDEPDLAELFSAAISS